MRIVFPFEANTTERAILIAYHLLGITDPKDIAFTIGHSTTSEVYRAMKKFRGKFPEMYGHDHNTPLIRLFPRS